MEKREFNAMVSLLNDVDDEIVHQIEMKVKELAQTFPELITSFLKETEEIDLKRKVIRLTAVESPNILYQDLLDWKNGGGLDLLEGWCLLSNLVSEQVKVDEIRDEVNRLYREAWIELRSDLHPMDEIEIMNHVFYNKWQFVSNTDAYYATENSLIGDVFESRKGNPISLCCVYLLVAQKLGLPIFGVNLPNIFVLTYKKGNLQFYINVFNQGEVFERAALTQYLKQIRIPQSDAFLQPCSHIDIVRRMARNLLVSFERQNDEPLCALTEKIIRILQE
ncbi:MAG: transglutaminase-like domain-containing protein [Spirosomataceae bacterium]